jgi:hypothetical protein
LLDEFHSEVDAMEASNATGRNRKFQMSGSGRDRYEVETPYLRYRSNLMKHNRDADSLTCRTEASTKFYSSRHDDSSLYNTHLGHGMDSIRCQIGDSPIHQHSSNSQDRRDDNNAYKQFKDDWPTKNTNIDPRKGWKANARHLRPTLTQDRRQDASPQQGFNNDWLKKANHAETHEQPRLRRMVEKLRAAENVNASDNRRDQKRIQNIGTEQLKQILRQNQEQFDKEKGALQTEIERLKRSHENQVKELRSDLQQAEGSHKIYFTKLNEVIDFHEALHEEGTAAMNKIVEELKKDKDEEISKLQQELYTLRSKSSQTFSKDLVDPDLQVCLDYLNDESKCRVHRFAQFEGTMRTLQSVAARKSSRGYSNEDRQDMDDLLDMLHHVYKVAEDSHARTMDLSKLLVSEHSNMSKRMYDYEKMKERLESLQAESAFVQEQQQLQRKEVCERCQVLAENMEDSLYRGLGFIQ